jgi:hypothetical protein
VEEDREEDVVFMIIADLEIQRRKKYCWLSERVRRPL